MFWSPCLHELAGLRLAAGATGHALLHSTGRYRLARLPNASPRALRLTRARGWRGATPWISRLVPDAAAASLFQRVLAWWRGIPWEDDGVSSAGRACCLAGLPREHCPYPPGSADATAWLKGWQLAAGQRAVAVIGSPGAEAPAAVAWDEPLPESIFRVGMDARACGWSRSQCPYPPGCAEREQWLAGWRHGAADAPVEPAENPGKSLISSVRSGRLARM